MKWLVEYNSFNGTQKIYEFNKEERFENAKLKFDDYVKKIKSQNDLWELDKVGELIEINMDDLDRGEYGKLHREVFPAHIKTLWPKDLYYDGIPLKRTLDKEHKFFMDKLSEEGFKSELAFIGYQSGMPDIEDEEGSYPDGAFYSAFDIYNDDESGIAVFYYKIEKSTSINDFKKVESMDDLLNLNYASTANYWVDMGEVNFRNRKNESGIPLWDWLADGGYLIYLA